MPTQEKTGTAFDKKQFITHSSYWKFLDTPNQDDRNSFYFLIRFIKQHVEKIFNIKIYKTNSEKDKAFVSYLSDPQILTYRLHLISEKLKIFFNEISIDCDEETLSQAIKQYDVIFRNSNVLNLDGGMGYNNGLILFCFSKLAQPSTVIESGVWKGFTTYLLDSSVKKDAKIFCFDINLGNVAWKSNKAEYFENDIQNVKLEIHGETTLAFFDDHVSQYDRLLFARAHSIRYLVFDDDVSYLNLHSDGWPPIPTISMLWNNEQLPKKFEWISNSRTGIADFSSCEVDFKNDYFYATAPELFELTGYRNGSRTSYLILK